MSSVLGVYRLNKEDAIGAIALTHVLEQVGVAGSGDLSKVFSLLGLFRVPGVGCYFFVLAFSWCVLSFLVSLLI